MWVCGCEGVKVCGCVGVCEGVRVCGGPSTISKSHRKETDHGQLPSQDFKHPRIRTYK